MAINGFLEQRLRISWFSINIRYSSTHVVIFFLASLVIICLTIFESTIIKSIIYRCKRFKDLQKQFDAMEALTDDYYNEMHVNFLLNEYLRTKIERKTYQKLLLEKLTEHCSTNQNEEYSNKEAHNTFLRHLDTLKHKQTTLEEKINELGRLLGNPTDDIKNNLMLIRKNENKIHQLKDYKIKSQI